MLEPQQPHRVLVVDDDPLVRGAYRGFFAQQHEFEVCAEAADGAEAVATYERMRPDLVLMDLQMPVLSGIEAIGRICGRWPEACVVALTTFGTQDYVIAALRAGAAGYLVKDVGGPGLLSGMRSALAGDMPLSGAVRRELVASVLDSAAPPASTDSNGLTDREIAVLGWLALGLTNSQIAGRMYVSEGSVKQYLATIGVKFGVKSRTGILIRSIQLQVVDPHALPPL